MLPLCFIAALKYVEIMHIAAYTFVRCLSVRPSRSSIALKHIFKLFHHLVAISNTIVVFRYQMLWQCFRRRLHNGRRMLVGYEKNCDFPPISRFISEMIQDRAIVTVGC